ncbi:hypothetical protein ACWDZX_33060 [Streptomyces collinus]
MRGSATDPTTTPGHRHRRRTAGTLASAALLLPLLGAAPAQSAPEASAGRLQQAFGSATRSTASGSTRA